MKLVPRLTLWFMLCTTLLLAARGISRLQHQLEVFDADMQRDHRFIGRALAADLGEIWRAEGAQKAQHLVDLATGTAGPGIKLVWLTNAGAGAVPDDDLGHALRGSEVQHFESGKLLSIFPVRGNSSSGALLVSEALTERERFVRSNVLHACVSLVSVIVCCGVLALVLGRWIVAAPVRLLVDKARRVGQGDFSTPLTFSRNDEFQSLAVAMNAMCDALERAKADLASEGHARHLAVEQLRHAERLSTVGKLAAGVAHELGTPLSIVSGHAEMIATGEVQGEKVVESATIIDRETQRIARIIRSLLGFARRTCPEGASCDVTDTARRCISLFQPLAERAELRVLLEPASNYRATIDQDSLQQVVANLLSNAIQATPAGGEIQLKVTSVVTTPPTESAGAPRSFVRMDVVDRGAGIAPEVLPHIFEPFFSTKAPGDGTGLGLSVVYGIIEDHRGWISVESKVTKGSHFSVFLPEATSP